MATTILLERQKLLSQLIHADVCTDCSITAYEAHTSAEAIALAQSVQPDVILLDLGTDETVEIAVARRRLDLDAHLTLLLDQDTANAPPFAPSRRPQLAQSEGQTELIQRFVLALRQACSELVKMEPDMIHHLLRTWHQHSLEALGSVERPAYRRLKILVFVVRTCRNSSNVQARASAVHGLRFLLGKEWQRIRLGRRTVEETGVAVRAGLSHLLHFVEDYTARRWRTV
jgi:hypothetical protein